jgi:thiosulfate/3-mercaptopyruvate sulfurtransferase
MNTYSHPEYLVETDWVAEHLDDPNVRIIESDEDALLYDMKHIPGAVRIDWFTTLQHPVRRDFLTKEQFEEVCSQAGITNDTTLVFYGDKSNWFACYALWIFEYYGHKKVKIMNGGRAKWEQEGRPMTKEVPVYTPTDYKASEPDKSIRAFREQVFAQIEAEKPLVDVRSPQEYTRRAAAHAQLPAGRSAARWTYPRRGQHSLVEGCQRSGQHVQIARGAALVI